MHDDVGFTAFLSTDFHIMPAELGADARAERFRYGFLRCESRRQKRPRFFVRQTIADLTRQQNAIHESLTKFFIGSFDAGNFDQINSDSENHSANVRNRSLTRKKTHNYSPAWNLRSSGQIIH